MVSRVGSDENAAIFSRMLDTILQELAYISSNRTAWVRIGFDHQKLFRQPRLAVDKSIQKKGIGKFLLLSDVGT